MSFVKAGSVQEKPSVTVLPPMQAAPLLPVSESIVTVGLTLLTVTPCVAAVLTPASSSVKPIEIVGVAGPSGNVHWNDPVWLPLFPVVVSEAAT